MTSMIAFGLLTACSSGDGSQDGGDRADAGAMGADAGAGTAAPDNPTLASYLRTLPAWREFSPKLDDRPPAPIEGLDPVHTVETVQQEVPADDGPAPDAGMGAEPPTVVRDVVYDCTETPYSLTSNPQELVVNDPNRDILYPGAMIQGRTHRDGSSVGDVLPLVIEKRAPIRVSIPDVANPDSENFRLVAPNQGEVSQAIGDIIGNATRDDLDTPSSVSFDMQTYHSEKQFALEAGLSGRYLGFSASASGSVERDASQTTVAVQFTQRMYTVVVEPPGAGAASFFSEDFTQEDLDALIEDGRIGPDNLPLYVSSVVYGRMMTFALTSSASESEIKAALRASYETFTGGVGVEVEARHRDLLQKSSIVLSTLGGDDSDALRVVRSGDWKQYFDQEAALSTAVPLSYTFKNLGDSSIAGVSESSEYTVKTCTAQQATPEVFDIGAVQTHTLDVGSVAEVIAADIDGDGIDDLVYNSRDGSNRIAVLQGSADGSFSPGATMTHAQAAPEGSWSQYQLAAGDVDGDGDDDLVWNYNRNLNGRHNILYVALSGNGQDGGFEQLPVSEVEHPSADSAYPFHLGDINGDGRADAIWTSVGVRDDANYVHLGLSQGDGTFRISAGAAQTLGSGSGWGPYQTHVADFDGDGLTDLLFNAVTDAANNVWTAFASPQNRNLALDAADLSSAFHMELFAWSGNWMGYHEPISPAGRYTLIGDLDADGGLDLLWAKVDPSSADVLVYAALNDGDAFVRSATETDGDTFEHPDGVEPGELTLLLADVAGDDRADLVISEADGATNRVHVGLSRGDGSFDYSPIQQTMALDPSDSAAFSQYRILVGSFGGSGKRDVLWVLPTAETRIYAGIAD